MGLLVICFADEEIPSRKGPSCGRGADKGLGASGAVSGHPRAGPHQHLYSNSSASMEQAPGTCTLTSPGCPCSTAFTGSPWPTKPMLSLRPWCRSPSLGLVILPAAFPASPRASPLPPVSASAFTAVSTEPSPGLSGSQPPFEPQSSLGIMIAEAATARSPFKAHVNGSLLQKAFLTTLRLDLLWVPTATALCSALRSDAALSRGVLWSSVLCLYLSPLSAWAFS